jgi:hypothetical protein
VPRILLGTVRLMEFNEHGVSRSSDTIVVCCTLSAIMLLQPHN